MQDFNLLEWFTINRVWFTDNNNRPLEIKDNINITLIIGPG